MAKRHRLDRFLSAHLGINRSDVRLILAKLRVQVDGAVATDIHQVVDQFSRITLDGAVVQDQAPVYLMMNKPMGVVSATKDARHRTVLDLIAAHLQSDLHLVGRLDFNSSGLLLLTNDGAWSRRLMSPEHKVTKVYEVTLQEPISDDCIRAFADGMFFAFEGITTQAAGLERLTDCTARVHLVEGRYHQIKRMFGRFQNKVLALHRIAIGNLTLDPQLAPGESRALTAQEVRATAS